MIIKVEEIKKWKKQKIKGEEIKNKMDEIIKWKN